MPLVFTREEDALVLAFRFAGMAFYVNCGLRVLQAAIGRPKKATTGEQELRKRLEESVATAERDLELLRDILERT